MNDKKLKRKPVGWRISLAELRGLKPRSKKLPKAKIFDIEKDCPPLWYMGNCVKRLEWYLERPETSTDNPIDLLNHAKNHIAKLENLFKK